MYHPETGYAYMGSIYDGGSVIQLSELGRLELVSAMRRKQRAGIVSEVGVSAALRRFSADLHSRYEMFTFTAPVVEDAHRILRASSVAIPLRTLDALQLAFYRVNCEPGTLFLCADRRLFDVVSLHGYPVQNPELASD